MNYKEIFEECKTIAVVGMSIYPYKAAHSVPLFMQKSGYKIIPINPNHEIVAKLKSYNNIHEIEEKIDMVNVFRPSEFALDIIKEVVERKKIKGDVSCIWLQEGIICDEGKELAESVGITYIEDECLYKVFVSM